LIVFSFLSSEPFPYPSMLGGTCTMHNKTKKHTPARLYAYPHCGSQNPCWVGPPGRKL